jgi:prolyl-tRNA editing enzyme YbaK/EbsC (Cys-tRNA(Pro) deacylase)
MIARVLANASVRRVQAALAGAGIAAEIIVTEEATPSSQAAAQKHGCDVAQIAKSVIFRALESDRVVLVIASGANRVDEALVVAAIGEPIGRADAAYVKQRTGFSIGGVAPLGHLSPPITLFDETLARFDVIYPAAGHPHTGFAVAPMALARAAGARVMRVCRADD